MSKLPKFLKRKKHSKRYAKVLLKGLKDEFKLQESARCLQVLEGIKLTLPYLEDFVAFTKKKDDKFSLAIISTVASPNLASGDIKRCLENYGVGVEHQIHYIDYNFAAGSEPMQDTDFQHSWILFVAKDEDVIINMLTRFHNLKVFL